MERNYDKKSESQSDKNKENKDSGLALFAEAYKDKGTSQLKTSDKRLDMAAEKLLPAISFFESKLSKSERQGQLDSSVAEAGKAVFDTISSTTPGAPAIKDIVGKTESIGAGQIRPDNSRQGNSGAEGSPGWNDFSARIPDSGGNSLADKVIDFLQPDYSAGENLGSGGAATKSALNDLLPARNPSTDMGGNKDRIFPPLPIGSLVEIIGGANADSGNSSRREAESQRRQQEQQKEKDRDKKEKQESSDKNKEGKEKSEREDNDTAAADKKKEDEKAKDDAKKDDKGNGRPNPDSDRRQLSKSEAEIARTELRTRIGGSLTTPSRPDNENRRSAAPDFGKTRSRIYEGNPLPDNEGSPERPGQTEAGASPVRRGKIDVRGGL